MRVRLRLIVCLLVLVSCLDASAQRRRPQPRKLTPRQVAAIIFPSTVSIYVSINGKRRYSGSGFIVAPQMVATCLHVVQPDEDEYDKALTELRGGNLLSIVTREKIELVASVYRRDEQTDIAILRVPALKGLPLKLSQRLDYYIGDPVYTVGDPRGLTGTFSNGIISNFITYGDVFYLQFTAPVSPGSSGGPVVDDHGRVVGIVNMQIADAQNLNFGVLVGHLESLLTGKQRPMSIDNNIKPLR